MFKYNKVLIIVGDASETVDTLYPVLSTFQPARRACTSSP